MQNLHIIFNISYNYNNIAIALLLRGLLLLPSFQLFSRLNIIFEVKASVGRSRQSDNNFEMSTYMLQ